MRLRYVARRLWDSPVATIWFMAFAASVSLGYELLIVGGVGSTIFLAQIMHTWADVGIFWIFERGYQANNKNGSGGGVAGITAGLFSFILILWVIRVTPHEVDTSLMPLFLSGTMLSAKLRYVWIALPRDKAHSSTIGAVAHVVGDIVINVSAFGMAVVAGLLRDRRGWPEGSIADLDFWVTVGAILVAIVASLIGYCVIYYQRIMKPKAVNGHQATTSAPHRH